MLKVVQMLNFRKASVLVLTSFLLSSSALLAMDIEKEFGDAKSKTLQKVSIDDQTFSMNKAYFEGDARRISGDENVISGELNYIHANNNFIQGRDNNIEGDDNKIWGDCNTVKGNRNKLFGKLNNATGEGNEYFHYSENQPIKIYFKNCVKSNHSIFRRNPYLLYNSKDEGVNFSNACILLELYKGIDHRSGLIQLPIPQDNNEELLDEISPFVKEDLHHITLKVQRIEKNPDISFTTLGETYLPLRNEGVGFNHFFKVSLDSVSGDCSLPNVALGLTF